jgi:hypothetical protein
LLLLISSVVTGIALTIMMVVVSIVTHGSQDIIENSHLPGAWFDLLMMGAVFSLYTLPLLTVGAVVLGLPTLLFARNFGLNKSAAQAFWVGGVVGGITGLCLLAMILPVTPVFWLIGGGTGFVAGGLAGILWWHWFEKSKLKEQI